MFDSPAEIGTEPIVDWNFCNNKFNWSNVMVDKQRFRSEIPQQQATNHVLQQQHLAAKNNAGKLI